MAKDNVVELKKPKGSIKALSEFTSALLQRSRFFSKLGYQFDQSRDLYTALGYKRELNFDLFLQAYSRQDIAGRIVDAYPDATWGSPPKLSDDKKDAESAFEKAWRALDERLGVLASLHQLDKLSGIGQFGALLIGSAGDVATPLRKGGGITYLRSFHEGKLTNLRLEPDPNSPRYGLPIEYGIMFDGAISSKVHWTRIIHAAETTVDGILFSIPRLQRVYNLLDDLQKVVGGSAEMFWQGAFRGLQIDVDKDLDLQSDDEAALSDEIEEYVHGIKRYIRTRGIKIDSITGDIADPKGTFSVIMSLISGATGIPQRIIMGSERGQLASSQDERNWASRIRERQVKFAETKILRPFVGMATFLGELPPVERYSVTWPDTMILSADQMITIALKAGQGLAHASKQTIVTVEEFREHFLGLPRTASGTMPEPPEVSKNEPGRSDPVA